MRPAGSVPVGRARMLFVTSNHYWVAVEELNSCQNKDTQVAL